MIFGNREGTESNLVVYRLYGRNGIVQRERTGDVLFRGSGENITIFVNRTLLYHIVSLPSFLKNRNKKDPTVRRKSNNRVSLNETLSKPGFLRNDDFEPRKIREATPSKL